MFQSATKGCKISWLQQLCREAVQVRDLVPPVPDTRDLQHRVLSNLPLFIDIYLRTQVQSAVEIDQAYDLAPSDLDTGRYSSIWAAAEAYILDNANLGRCRRGQEIACNSRRTATPYL